MSQDELATVLGDLKRRGFRRIYQNGQTFEYSRPESLLDVDFKKPAYVLVDRLKIAPDIRQRLIDSIEICFRENNGEVFLAKLSDGAHSTVSAKRSSARSAASDTKTPNQSCFHSTTRSARARDARDSAIPSTSISTSSSPTRANR